MMQVFTDKTLQQKFDRDGYVVISLADNNIVQELSNLYKKVQPESYKGFSSTIYNPDIALKTSTSDSISDLLNEGVKKHFQNFRSLGCSFLCKTSCPESFMPTHQDWTIVDESKFDSITIWMPLVDTHEENGALRVLPGSHRFSDVLRSPTLPGVFQKINNEVFDSMELLTVKAGDAVVFSHALLHSSKANLSGADRVVATYGLVHADAELCFYHKVDEKQVEKYRIPDNFFITYNKIGSAPENGEKLEVLDYKWKEWNSTDLKIAIQKHKNLLNRINMKKLFKDDIVQDFFAKNGYVKFNVLNPDEIKTLLDYYYAAELHQENGAGFSMSMELNDKTKVARVREKIFEVALPKAMNHFYNAKVIAGSYVVKDYNPVCIVPPHQDWSFVDNEGEYCSVTCWIPLVDTTIENGAMGVIKGSHLMLNNIRSSPSPQVPTPLMDHQFSLFPYLEMIEMKAGEALVFDHRTFHASTPNTTNQPRVAIGLGFTQGDATICHYTMKINGKKDTLLKYYVDDAFLLKYDNALLSRMYDANQSIEGYEVAEEIPFEFMAPSLEELVAMVTQAGNPLNTELSGYMANLFGYNSNSAEALVERTEPVLEEVVQQDTATLQKPYKGAYTPMNILREIKLRLTGSKN